ncbi:MAG: hypothetical protein JRJ03_00680 [Deltaproteobacteria bacterium]|nr:hypothetical protein [Deltaproteobacteria bacterium]
MIISEEKLELLNTISDFDRRIEKMHLDFQKYHSGVENRMPDWEALERDLLAFSRRKIYEIELSNRLDRVLHKFQNRKRIWLSWVEEVHRGPRQRTVETPK